MNTDRREQYSGTKRCLCPAEKVGRGLEFWKDAWLQPHSKERSAPHTLRVATRGTDMEKYKR